MALPVRPRFSDFKKVTSIQGTQEVVGLNPNEANASDKNARFSLEDLRKFVLTGLPTSPGKWVTQPTVTVTVTEGKATVSVSAGTADFNGVTVNYAAFTQSNVTLPSSGLQRLDAVAAKADGTYQYVSGTSSQNPVTPAIATGALLANYLLYNEAGATTTKPTTTISVVDAVTDGDLNAVTSNAVFDALAALEVTGEYLPLTLTEDTTVNLNDKGLGFAWDSDLAPVWREVGLWLNGNGLGYISKNLTPGDEYEQSQMIHLSPTQRQVVNLLRWKDASASIEHGVLNGEPYFKVTTVKGEASNSLEFKLGKIYVNGVEFTGGSGASTFTALTDTPSSYTAGKWLKVNSAGNALEWTDAPTGVSTWLGLTDTPNSFASQALKMVRVNANATALEFVDAPTGGTTIPSTRTPQTGTTLVFNQSKIQTRTLTDNLTIATISNAVLSEAILFEVDGRNNSFALTLPASVIKLNGSDFVPSKLNFVYLHCINTTTLTFTATISQP